MRKNVLVVLGFSLFLTVSALFVSGCFMTPRYGGYGYGSYGYGTVVSPGYYGSTGYYGVPGYYGGARYAPMAYPTMNMSMHGPYMGGGPWMPHGYGHGPGFGYGHMPSYGFNNGPSFWHYGPYGGGGGFGPRRW